MNLIEAVKTGLPLKRPGWTWVTRESQSGLSVTWEQILADDWEVKREPREWWLIKQDEVTGSFMGEPVVSRSLVAVENASKEMGGIRVREVLDD